MRLSVEAAGRREPCFERSERAGGQFGRFGAGGVRYRDRRVWYIDGRGSSGSEVEARRDCIGEDIGDASVKWIRLQYLEKLVGMPSMLVVDLLFCLLKVLYLKDIYLQCLFVLTQVTQNDCLSFIKVWI